MEISSVFEIIMLVCFAASWPFSIVKALRTRVVAGKSPMFMIIIEVGYIAGMLFKITGNMDGVFWLYVFNFLIVGFDLSLYYRFRNNKPQPERKSAA